MGPMGSGLPQFGLPRRFAMKYASPVFDLCKKLDSADSFKDSDPHALLTDKQNERWGPKLRRKIVSGTPDFTSEAGKVNDR